jgi:hypothetical protein
VVSVLRRSLMNAGIVFVVLLAVAFILPVVLPVSHNKIFES